MFYDVISLVTNMTSGTSQEVSEPTHPESDEKENHAGLNPSADNLFHQIQGELAHLLHHVPYLPQVFLSAAF
ncbi:hypothetical protein RIT80_11435 [Streptococcus pneumoniae]|nr:hypothetical protein [Streptococcus pneumoniae]MDR7845150.1 hypothetical protein [Streptococcus pneumoniae]